MYNNTYKSDTHFELTRRDDLFRTRDGIFTKETKWKTRRSFLVHRPVLTVTNSSRPDTSPLKGHHSIRG